MVLMEENHVWTRSNVVGHMLYLKLDRGRVKRLANNYNGLQGFLVFNTAGGGLGLDISSLLLKFMLVDCSKKSKLAFTVYPLSQVLNEYL